MINLNKNKTYLLACSFGPDSMALFDMLEKGNYRFAAALVNYHLREESDTEMNSFIKYCQTKKVAYHVLDYKEEIGYNNIESQCREIRYKYFAQLVDDYHYDEVLVAHNQDDLIETYFLQKNRKNLPVFYGIKEKTVIYGVNIYRPLLTYTKQELLQYCVDNHVPYSIDKTNLEDRFLRNRIRHNVVCKMNKNERGNVIKEINEKNQYLSILFKKLDSIDLSNVSQLEKLELIELAYALNCLVKLKDERINVSMRQTKEIREIFKLHNGNIDVPLTYGFFLRKSYDRIEIIKPEYISYEFVIKGPSITNNEYFYFDGTGDTSNRNIRNYDYPLTIRNYRFGDKYKIKDYEVSVRRLFIDWKMPKSLRDRWPIVVNKDSKIIYIPRYRSDFKPTKNINFYVK